MWVLAAVAACGCTATQYVNERNPAATRAELLSDTEDCQRKNMRMLDSRWELYKDPIMVVDPEGTAQCLAARGWRPVPK